MDKLSDSTVEKDAGESRAKKSGETGLFDVLWNFFSDLKVAIVLLIVIAAASILGTVILQNGRPEQYVQAYGIAIYNAAGSSFLKHLIPIDYDVDPQKYVDVFGEMAYGRLRSLGLTHMYSSFWYVALLGMLGFSIFVCSVNRARMLLDMRNRTVRDFDPDRLMNFTNSRRVEIRGSAADAERVLRKALGANGFRPKTATPEAGRLNFDAEKGGLRLWGSFFTHSSLLLIFFGAIFGVYAGFEDFKLVSEGESFYVAQGDYWVRADDFSVEYDKMLRPLDYKSDLVVFEGGKEVLKKTIEVNHPLIYKGVYFYQSSFGARSVELRIEREDGTSSTVSMTPNEPAVVDDRLPRLFFGSDDVFADKKSPRIFLRFIGEDGSPKGLDWLTREKPIDMVGTRIYLGDIWEYTGLQVKRDPGIPLVWVGCVLLVCGMYMMFYIRRRRVFGAVRTAGDGMCVITVAGSAGKGDDGFAEGFKKLGDALEEMSGKKREAAASV